MLLETKINWDALQHKIDAARHLDDGGETEKSKDLLFDVAEKIVKELGR